jgi:predicted transcriptional regulator
MERPESREEWLARKVAEAEASVRAGRVYTHDEAEAKMAAFKTAYSARPQGKAA